MALLEQGRTVELVDREILPVDLRDNLLPESLEFYDLMSPELQEQHQRALHGVTRMGTIREGGFLIPEDYIETNLMHVYEGNHMALEYSEKYPILSQSIDFSEVQKIYLHHDDGEVIPSVGDVQPLNRTAEEERRKKLEGRMARRYVFSKIPDEVSRAEIIKYYDRYQENDPRDLAVQMSKWIDKSQGTTRVAEKAFNAKAHRGRGNEDIAINIERHLWQTVPRMMEPAMNLMTYLPNEKSREDMRDIILNELAFLEESGVHPIYKTFSKGVRAA